MHPILLTILIFLSVDYFLRLTLALLNRSRMGSKPAPEVEGIYEAERYHKSQAYQRTLSNTGLWAGAVSFALTFFMLVFKGFAWFDHLAIQLIDHPVLTALVFFALLGLLSDLVSLPFELYNTFVTEERFGFNTTSKATYLKDKVKGWVLTLVIGGIALSLLIFTWKYFGFWFWVPAWFLIGLIIVLMSGVGSLWIGKLFNKFTPLEDGDLKERITAFAQKANLPLREISVMDGSRRSNKANAYFAGIGKTKRIVLFDTLLQKLDNYEVVAVLAHEAGHYKLGHINKMLFTSLIQVGVMLFLLALALGIPELSLAFGVNYHSFHIGLLAFVMLYTPITFVMGLFGNMVSRRFEFEADTFASNAGFNDSLVKALKKLTAENMSNLTPHPAYVFFNYSHPDIASRLKHLKRQAVFGIL